MQCHHPSIYTLTDTNKNAANMHTNIRNSKRAPSMLLTYQAVESLCEVWRGIQCEQSSPIDSPPVTALFAGCRRCSYGWKIVSYCLPRKRECIGRITNENGLRRGNSGKFNSHKDSTSCNNSEYRIHVFIVLCTHVYIHRIRTHTCKDYTER